MIVPVNAADQLLLMNAVFAVVMDQWKIMTVMVIVYLELIVLVNAADQQN